MPGRVFGEQMALVLDAWRREPVPGDALAVAQRIADRHRAKWDADNG